MRAFRMACSVAMSDSLGGDGGDDSHTFDDLTAYLEEARKTPTGRLWMDCLIKPTHIAHLFIRWDFVYLCTICVDILNTCA